MDSVVSAQLSLENTVASGFNFSIITAAMTTFLINGPCSRLHIPQILRAPVVWLPSESLSVIDFCSLLRQPDEVSLVAFF